MVSRSPRQSFADALHAVIDEGNPPIDRYERAELNEWIEQVQAIRTILAPLVIANDLRGGDDWCEHVVRLLGDERLTHQIQELRHRLGERRTDDTNTVPAHDKPKDLDDLSSVALSLALAWGRAGYLIGLAVGMQLGPHAFDPTPKTGAR